MFRKTKFEIGRLNQRTETLRDDVNELKERIERMGKEAVTEVKALVSGEIDRLKPKIESLKAEISDLRKFYLQEYISSIDRLFDFVKTISVITSVSGKDLIGLKRELMAPIVDARNQQIENQRAEAIGHSILAKKKKLEDERLKIEREGGDTTRLDNELKALNAVLEEK